MARKTERRILRPLPGWRSREAASFYSQLGDVYHRVFADLEGVTPAELAWQPRAGTNTAGMLLAHMAIVEVFWLMLADETYERSKLERVLGIGEDDDGMPMPEGGLAPVGLRGRPLVWYHALIRKGHAFGKRTARRWTDRDLDRVLTRTRKNGDRTQQNLRWVLYHVVEHQAGHHGQILLLRHLYRDRRK